MSPPEAQAGRTRLLLAIESTCDETAAAVIREDLAVLSSVVASQAALHERFGGVVPELAARAHLERILPVIDEALQNAHVSPSELSAVAVAAHPGLIGSLLVGVTAAKTLAFALDLPLIAVDHVAGHLYACLMHAGRNPFPAVGLVVSGGHTNLYDCRTPLDHRLLGSTIDDAAGEAFDKVAAILGLAYPGGPSIERAGREGNPRTFAFPRAFSNQDKLAFSFSGLKTAVLYEVQGQPGSGRQPPPLTPARVADIAASFEQAVVDILVEKCRLALRRTGHRMLCLGGGVAANSRFREHLQAECTQQGVELLIAPREYCTDNAAMGAIAWEKFQTADFASLDLDPLPGLVRAGPLRN